MIKRILFDIDNTLIEWKEEYNSAVRQALEELHISFDEKMVEQIIQTSNAYEHNGDITYDKETMWKNINASLTKPLPLEFIDTWLKYLSQCVPERLENEVYETLDYLSKKYELVVLSNWFASSQRNRMKKVNIEKYFVACYFTEGIPMKPNPEAFMTAIGNNRPEECIMIGDNLAIDILPAIELGIQSIYLNRKDLTTKKKDTGYEVIHSISELRSML